MNFKVGDWVTYKDSPPHKIIGILRDDSTGEYYPILERYYGRIDSFKFIRHYDPEKDTSECITVIGRPKRFYESDRFKKILLLMSAPFWLLLFIGADIVRRFNRALK